MYSNISVAKFAHTFLTERNDEKFVIYKIYILYFHLLFVCFVCLFFFQSILVSKHAKIPVSNVLFKKKINVKLNNQFTSGSCLSKPAILRNFPRQNIGNYQKKSTKRTRLPAILSLPNKPLFRLFRQFCYREQNWRNTIPFILESEYVPKEHNYR